MHIVQHTHLLDLNIRIKPNKDQQEAYPGSVWRWLSLIATVMSGSGCWWKALWEQIEIRQDVPHDFIWRSIRIRSSDILSPNTYHHYLPLCLFSQSFGQWCEVLLCLTLTGLWDPAKRLKRVIEVNISTGAHWDFYKPTTHKRQRGKTEPVDFQLLVNEWCSSQLETARFPQ